MGASETLGLPSPRECPGIVGVAVSLAGAAGSIWAFLRTDGATWSFVLLALFALLGWTSFMWCVVWEETPPDLREGAGIVGLVSGAVGLGVGLLAGFAYGSPRWSYVLVLLSTVVIAASLVWGDGSR